MALSCYNGGLSSLATDSLSYFSYFSYISETLGVDGTPLRPGLFQPCFRRALWPGFLVLPRWAPLGCSNSG